MKTSKRIYLSARCEFLKYGYHAASLNRIALNSGVVRPSVHYYFRGKAALYEHFLRELVTDFFDKHQDIQSYYYQHKAEYIWFILTEMHNNRAMFVDTLNRIDRKDWKNIFMEMILSEHQYLTMIFRLTGQSLLSLNTNLPDIEPSKFFSG